MPFRYVRVQEQWPAHETIDFIQIAEAELSVLKSFVNLVIYVLRVKLLYQGYPSAPLHLLWEQMLFFCDLKVALMCDQRGIGEEEAESTRPKPSVTFFHALGVAFGACDIGSDTLGVFRDALRIHILPEAATSLGRIEVRSPETGL